MKKLTLAAVLLTAMFSLVACGKVNHLIIREQAMGMAYEVVIKVDIDMVYDPELYIRAKDIEIDRVNKKVMVKGMGFLTSIKLDHLGDSNTFAIKVENNAVFSVPLGGRITIKHPDGKIEVLEQY